MNTDFPTLLQELFHGNSRQLRVLLQPLTAEQRRALFGEFKELLKVLKRACRFQADAKTVSLPELYRAIHDDPAGFVRDRADALAAPGALNNTQWMRQLFYTPLMEFYSRLQLLLDRLDAVLQDVQCGVSDPAARRTLETLAAAKKSVSRDKASAALARRADSPPTRMLALATHSDNG